MTPIANQDNREGTKALIFRCNCSGGEFLEMAYDDDLEGIWFLHYDSHYPSLWETLRRWWRKKDICVAEVLLTSEDLEAMKEKIEKFLEERKQKNV